MMSLVAVSIGIGIGLMVIVIHSHYQELYKGVTAVTISEDATVDIYVWRWYGWLYVPGFINPQICNDRAALRVALDREVLRVALETGESLIIKPGCKVSEESWLKMIETDKAWYYLCDTPTKRMKGLQELLYEL